MSRELQTNNVPPNGKTSRKGLKSVLRSPVKKTRGRLRLVTQSKAATLVDDSDEDNDDDAAEEDEQTTDSNDEDVIAPSGRSNHKRGHQTGLSVSLSNATIVNGNRKRTWSNRVQEKDEMKRPVKISKEGHSSSNEEDDDSDDGYEGIDLISESDDEDMEREEEEWIVRSEEEDNDDGNDNDNDDEETRPNSSSSSASWEGFESNGGVQEDSFFTEHFERTDAVQDNLTKTTRKVRFVDEITGVASSSTETTDSEDDFFPDLMIQQDQLDSRFRAILERESDSEGSYLDLRYGDTAVNDDESEEDGSSSGYESDEGETTDEEILPPPTIRPQSSQNANAKSPSRTPQKSIKRSSSTFNSNACRQGPSLASWTVDPAKPYAIVDKSGSNMIFYPAQRPQTKANALSRNDSTNVSPGAHASGPDNDDEADQFSQSSAAVMTSGLNDGFASISKLFGSQIVGPPEAFFPWRSVDAHGQVIYDDEDYEDDDDLDMEENLDINDFIDFGDSSDSSAEEANEEEEEDKSTSEPMMPHHPAAFRRNQLRVQTLNQSSRTVKADVAVKEGRLDIANQLISPLRKQKNRSSQGITTSTKGLTSISNV